MSNPASITLLKDGGVFPQQAGDTILRAALRAERD